MAAVRQEMMGQGPEEQPEIPQRQAAPEAPQNPSTEALMSGAADAARVAAMAQGGAVKGYAGSGAVIGQDGLPPDPTELLRIATTTIDPITRSRAKAALNAMRGQVAPQEVAPPPESAPMQPPQARMQQFAMQAPSMPDVNIEQPEPDPAAGQEKPARPAGRDYYALLEKMAEEGGSEATSSKDKYMALLQASLGTMAAASQPGGTFLGSIGQGGLLGVESLQKLKAARAEDRMKKMTLYGTLAGRQEASEDRDAALAQAKLLAEEKLRNDQKQFDRADDTDRLIPKGQYDARMAEIGAANIRAAEKVADKKDADNKTKATDRREYALRVAAWKKDGGIFLELPDDQRNGFPNPQGSVDEAEESTKSLVNSKLTPFVLQTKLKVEAPKAQEDFIESYRALSQAEQAAEDLKNMPGKSSAIGGFFGSPIQKTFSTESGIFKTDLDQFNAKLKEIKSGKVIGDLVSQRQNSPKGSTIFGQLTEKELETAMSSGTSLDPKLGDEFDATLDRHISNLKSRRNALVRQWTQHYGELPKGFDNSVSNVKKDGSVDPVVEAAKAELARREAARQEGKP